MTNLSENNLNLYELKPSLQIPALLATFTGLTLLNSQQILLKQTPVIVFAGCFLLIFFCICSASKIFADRMLGVLGIQYPNVLLWLYPTITLFSTAFVSFAFMELSKRYLGRAYWNEMLGLTGQDTTTFIFSCFASVMLMVVLHFIFSVFRFFFWISNSSKERFEKMDIEYEQFSKKELSQRFENIKNQSKQCSVERLKATRFNRLAMLVIFIMIIAGGLRIVFFRPELVLYYRAEIQLKTFLQPEAAYNTLEHLTNKYPDYEFLDSVNYRMAWILDRRLHKHQKAYESYEAFLDKFGLRNIWTPEAITSLVRLSLDKLNEPQKAIFWADTYLNLFPTGVMRPHMYIYKIRSELLVDNKQKAQQISKEALKKYKNTKVLLINSEDRAIGRLLFKEALESVAANILPNGL